MRVLPYATETATDTLYVYFSFFLRLLLLPLLKLACVLQVLLIRSCQMFTLMTRLLLLVFKIRRPLLRILTHILVLPL